MEVVVVDMGPPLQVEVWHGAIDSAILELRKKVLRDNIFKEIKTREEPSPSVKRRTKRRKARRRAEKLKGKRYVNR
jgi:ribosomal protein S21